RVLHPGPGVCGRDRCRGVDIPAPSRSRPLKRALPHGQFCSQTYVFNYDMVAFSWVIIKLMDRGDNNAWDYGLMLAVWAVPFLTVPLGMARHSDFVPADPHVGRKAHLAAVGIGRIAE